MASANPPSVIRLMLWPVTRSPMMPARMESGIETDTITVERQSPRNKRIISDTRIEEMIASRTTLVTAARTNTDWSKSSLSSMPLGAAASIWGSISRVASTTARVEASECLRMVR